MIQLNGVSKTYGSTVALQPLTLTIPSATSTVLIGPSGCGKSTVLRLIAGLIEPATGSISFQGEPLTRSNVMALRQRLGYVIQDGGLFPHLTAARNIVLMAEHLDWPAAAIEKRLEELCELTRFPRPALSRYPIELSGGQRQRVALMRALMLRPQWLLMDEPFGGLAPIVRSGLLFDLKWIFKKLGQTVVLVTHHLFEAAYLADQIALFEEGRLVQKGTLPELEQKPADRFVTDFIQSQRLIVNARPAAR